MKTLTSGILTILAYLSFFVCGIWAIVEFILYLAKDHPFNWNSLWFLIGSIIVLIVSGLVYVFSDASAKITRSRTSNFQKRLEEMEKQRKERLNQ